jgi:D-lactate dehydrogenase
LKIAFFEVQNWEEPYLSTAFKSHELRFFKDVLTDENVTEVKDYEIISIFIYSRLTAEILSKLEALRLVATRSTGFDHIDLETCKKREY